MRHVTINTIAFGTAIILLTLSPSATNATELPPGQSYDKKVMSSLTTTSELPVVPLRSTGGTYEAEAGLATVSIPKDP